MQLQNKNNGGMQPSWLPLHPSLSLQPRSLWLASLPLQPRAFLLLQPLFFSLLLLLRVALLLHLHVFLLLHLQASSLFLHPRRLVSKQHYLSYSSWPLLHFLSAMIVTKKIGKKENMRGWICG